MNILECTANGAGACRNESMILDLTAERDAARADCATLHKMLDETVAERDAALRNYQNARIVYEVVIDERDVARAEADALRTERAAIIEDYQDRLAGAFMDIGALVMERDALREQVKLLREQVSEDLLILDTPRMCCSCHEVTNDNVLCETCYEDRIA